MSTDWNNPRKIDVLIGLPVLGLALGAVSGPFRASERKRGIPWWGWVIIIVLGALLLPWLWWWLRRRPEEESARQMRPRIVPIRRWPRSTAAEKPVPSVHAAVTGEEEAAPDDLKRIEGIGPKISSVLQAAGITTFRQLAATGVGRLSQILRGANIRLADPGTWPEQASLAAAGDWDALEKLQDELQGGRRV
jgi:predicted flap endonuclease-1-like 5' DNA nuclease